MGKTMVEPSIRTTMILCSLALKVTSSTIPGIQDALSPSKALEHSTPSLTQALRWVRRKGGRGRLLELEESCAVSRLAYKRVPGSQVKLTYKEPWPEGA